MITMDSGSMKMIGPGQYKSMGTGGLKPEEVDGLLPHRSRLLVLRLCPCKFRRFAR